MSPFEICIEVIIILLTVSGPLYYIWQTLHGTVVPHRLTYFFWFLVQVIAVAASLYQGASFLSQFVIILSSVTCLLVFISSFYQRDGTVWKLGFFDWTCAVLSLVGILLWQVTDIPNLAIIFAILADLVITLPTILKSYKSPETESLFSYTPYFIAHLLNIFFFVKVYDFPTLAMPFYLIINIVLIISAILMGRYKKSKDMIV